MISIVDPEQLKNVLRPTVYAAAVDALRSKYTDGAVSAERAQGWSHDSRRDQGVWDSTVVADPVSSSQHG